MNDFSAYTNTNYSRRRRLQQEKGKERRDNKAQRDGTREGERELHLKVKAFSRSSFHFAGAAIPLRA